MNDVEEKIVIENNKTTSWTDRKLESGTYYKYYIQAYKLVNGEKVWLAKSKVIHATTTGGKYGNAHGVDIKSEALELTVGEKSTLIGEERILKLPIKEHAATRYESSDPAIAEVGVKSGVITAKKTGKCIIYVYAQNGKCVEVEITVK